MRIWLQMPSQRGKDRAALKPYRDILDRAKRPDTEVSFRPLPPGPGLSTLEGFGYYGLRFLNDREILKNALRASQEGFDAVVIGCYFDPAVRAARQLSAIPVVGVAEASMLLASLMGLRFAVVTSDHRYIQDMVETIHLYGMASRALGVKPVRAIALSEAEFLGCLAGQSEPLVEDFQRQARACTQDGAEVIIAGCGLMSPLLTQAGLREVDGVPVIDPIIAGIKLAEMMVDLHRAGFPIVGRHGFFAAVPPGAAERARAAGLL